MSKTRRARRKLSDADVAELAKEFDEIIQRVYMPKILEAVDDRVKQVLTYFYEQAQKNEQVQRISDEEIRMQEDHENNSS
jgi:hypothetical protein